MCLRPSFSTTGHRRAPRALRAARGRCELCPSRSKKPWALPARSAIADALGVAGAYISERPASCTAAGRMLGDVSPEAGETLSKLGQSDDTVPVDHPQFRWLWTILPWSARLDERSLFGARAGSGLGMARGSGDSVDRASKLLSLAEVKKRGL